MDFEQIELDPELAEGGVWFTGPDGNPDALFLVASVHSKRYRQALARVAKVAGAAGEIYAMAAGILLGWQGQVFLDRAKQAEPTPYSQGAARAALGNDLFRAWVKELAGDSRNYRKQS